MNQCHYCKATDEDLAQLFDEKYGQKMDALNEEVKKHRAVFNKAHKAVKESGINLDFTMGTIMSDKEAFSKMIPHLDDIFAAQNILVNSDGRGYNKNAKLSELVGRMKNVKPAAVQGVGMKLKAYTDRRDDFKHNVKRVPISKIGRDEPIEFDIHVCPICDKVLEKTAKAAYDVLHADDGWD